MSNDGGDGAIRTFIVCSGLGRTRRGYEAAFRQIHDALLGEPGLDLRLFKGGGASTRTERALWNLPRRSRLANAIGERFSLGNPLLGRGYYVEQLTFFVSLLPHLVIGRPHVIYFSDKDLGVFLARWRRLTGARYKLLFRNGGPYPPPYRRFDHVQQVTSVYLERALAAGSPTTQQSLLPEAFAIPPEFTPPTPDEQATLRRRLGLPEDRPMVLSVSAVNVSHKRLDYLIREVAALDESQPFLLILGEADAETPQVAALADALLGAEGYRIDSVAAEAIVDYYRAADLLVLASTREGFGRVMVEAMSQGLACLAHDYGISRYVLGEYGYFADFTAAGALTDLIRRVLTEGDCSEKRTARHQSAYQRFGSDGLRDAYVAIIRRSAEGAAG